MFARRVGTDFFPKFFLRRADTARAAGFARATCRRQRDAVVEESDDVVPCCGVGSQDVFVIRTRVSPAASAQRALRVVDARGVAEVVDRVRQCLAHGRHGRRARGVEGVEDPPFAIGRASARWPGDERSVVLQSLEAQQAHLLSFSSAGLGVDVAYLVVGRPGVGGWHMRTLLRGHPDPISALLGPRVAIACAGIVLRGLTDPFSALLDSGAALFGFIVALFFLLVLVGDVASV